MESKILLGDSNVLEDIVPPFGKFLSVFEAAMNDREAHFGKEGCGEDRHKRREHSEPLLRKSKSSKISLSAKWKHADYGRLERQSITKHPK